MMIDVGPKFYSVPPQPMPMTQRSRLWTVEVLPLFYHSNSMFSIVYTHCMMTGVSPEFYYVPPQPMPMTQRSRLWTVEVLPLFYHSNSMFSIVYTLHDDRCKSKALLCTTPIHVCVVVVLLFYIHSFLGRLRPPKCLTSTLCTCFRQYHTTALLDSSEGETKECGWTSMEPKTSSS